MPYVEFESTRIASFSQVEQMLYFTDGRWAANRELPNKKLRLSRLSDGIALYFRHSRIMQWQRDDLLILDGNDHYNFTTRALLNSWLPLGVEIVLAGDYWVLHGLNDPLAVHLNTTPKLPYFHRNMVIDLQTRTEFSAPYELTDEIIEWNRGVRSVNADGISVNYQGPHKLRGYHSTKKKGA